MKLTLTAAAALIALATSFGPAGAAPAASLPDGTPVIEAGGRHGGGQHSGQRRGGREFGHRGGGRRSEWRGGGRRSGWRGGGRRSGWHGGGRRYGRHGGGHGGHRHGHGNSRPYVYGGIALGTYLFLDALDHH